MPNPQQSTSGSNLTQMRRRRVKATKAKALKRHELESSPKAKYRRLRRLVRGLVYENGALCDEAARAQRLVLQAQEERRFLLQKLIQREQQSAAAAPAASPQGPAPAAAPAAAATPAGGGGTLASHGAARPAAPLTAVSGTSAGRVSAAASGRPPAPLAAVAGTGAGRPVSAVVAGSGAGRPGAQVAAGRPPAVPLTMAVARGTAGRLPVPLAVVSGTAAGRLSAPLVVTAATNAGRLTSPLVVATGVGATRLSAPLVAAAGTALPSAVSVQPGGSSQPLAAAVGTTPVQRRPAASPRRGSRPARRLVSAAPRDPSGAVLLPLRLGALTLQTLGGIPPDRPAYHSASALYPAGFVSLRKFVSVVSPPRPCIYRCAIEDAGVHPRFTITATSLDASSGADVDIPSDTHELRDESTTTSSTSPPTAACFGGRTADDCHRQLLQRLSGALGRPLPAACRVSGDAFFGLTHPSVQQLLQALPGAGLCGRYRPLMFEVTERAVPVPAETEPALSTAALWQRLEQRD